jgi:hypothetical protein
LNAEFLNDPLNTPNTDGGPGLAKLLGDDLGRGVRVKKTVSNDLSNHGIRSTIVGLGAAGLVGERLGASFSELFQEDIVVLPSKTIFLTGFRGRKPFTVDLVEHG